MRSCVKLEHNLINKQKMKTMNYKGKGEHSVNELELIISQQVEELHLLKSGQKQLPIHGVGWRSELLPDFDVKEINEILQDCKEKKDDLQALVCRIWNKGYMTAVTDER
jgi:hypothetical protein